MTKFWSEDRVRKLPIFARFNYEDMVDSAWSVEHVAWWDMLQGRVWVSRYVWLARFMRNWHQGWRASALPGAGYGRG